jgi:hypothetical protein
MPNGTDMCTVRATSDSSGTVQGSCNLSRKAPPGQWKALINSFSVSGYVSDLNSSVLQDPFFVE